MGTIYDHVDTMIVKFYSIGVRVLHPSRSQCHCEIWQVTCQKVLKMS